LSPNRPMASKVNLWTIPVEDFHLPFVVTTGTEGLLPLRCAATFRSLVSVRDCTQQSSEVKTSVPVAWACWLRRCCCRASETRACPTSAKQNDKINSGEPSQFGRQLDARAASGLSFLVPALLQGNAGNVSGANQSDEVGNADAARRLGIRLVPVLRVRAPRSSLAASVRSSSSPTRPAGFFTDRSCFSPWHRLPPR
jgi:hypothetical protein